MRTTNAAIISAYKTAHNIPPETPLLTLGVWYNKGYTIKKGERPAARVELLDVSCKYRKTVSLFTDQQVQKI